MFLCGSGHPLTRYQLSSLLSLLLREGVHPKLLQKLFWHANIFITLDDTKVSVPR